MQLNSDGPYSSAGLTVAGSRPPFTNGGTRFARAEMRKRARRRSFFKASLFSDPAWDILLELFAADEEGRAVSISAAGRAAAIPLTTAIRWINVLQQEGLIQREDDPFHGRRSYLLLTEAGLRAMREYFLSCGDVVAARGAF